MTEKNILETHFEAALNIVKADPALAPQAMRLVQTFMMQVMELGDTEVRHWLSSEDEASVAAHGKRNLWRDREVRSETCVRFVRRVYGQWIGRGLTIKHIWKIDKSLYAYILKSDEFAKEMGELLPTAVEARKRMSATLGIDLPKTAAERERAAARLGWRCARATRESKRALTRIKLAQT